MTAQPIPRSRAAIDRRYAQPAAAAVLLCAAIGLGWGVLARVLTDSPTAALHDLVVYAAVWIAGIATIGRTARSPQLAAWSGAAAYGAAVIGYYGWSTLVLGRPADLPALGWAAVAVTVCPALAALTSWSLSARGVLGGIVLAVLAGAILVDGTTQQLLLRATGQLPATIALHPVQAVLDFALVLLTVLVLPRSGRTRFAAVVAAVPCIAFLPGTLAVLAYSTGLLD
ncbi:DUF6518 family protein [uncultured Amnibacterium sp.]|uniref:DUF6518 family protein n=1 Tax=uncultured Amnibacterium sp. TaxID=1631851 RepID=UPI0035CBB485